MKVMAEIKCIQDRGLKDINVTVGFSEIEPN